MHNSKFSRLFPWLIWSAAALFYCYENMLQTSQGIMINLMMQDFSITPTQVSLFGSFFLIAYSGNQFIVGLLLDRYSPRWLLTCACMTCAIGCMIFANTHLFYVAILARTLMGFGASFAALTTFKLTANWFPSNRFATLAGCMLFLGMLGGILTEAPYAALLPVIGWRTALNLFSAFGICLTIAIFCIVRDKPDNNTAQPTHSYVLDTKDLLLQIKFLLKSQQAWMTALFGMLMFTPFLSLVTLWGPDFLLHAYPGIDNTHAAWHISFLLFGFMLGAPSMGMLADWTRKRKLSMTIAAVGTLLTLSCSIFCVQFLSLWALTPLLFLTGFFTSGFVPAFSIIKEAHPRRIEGATMGFMNTWNQLGTAFSLPIIGALISTMTSMLHYLPSVFSYQLALAILPVLTMLACALLPFIKETACIQMD